MNTKTISSTQAQNNFGRIIDDVVQNGVKYVVQRRSSSQAIIISLTDFEALLNDITAQEKLSKLVRELSPTYNLGKTITLDKETT
jgi:PHD/YefM family antitoxin component YafN of YafNO toxin-antitoxin module